jgi:PAS domain S-box-containing protein
MNDQYKSKEQLIKELQELQFAHNSLKATIEADLLSHKLAEEKLLASEEWYQLLFNKAPLGYQSLDYDGNFIEVNQQWIDTLGYEREEVIGKWFGDFLTPAFQDGFRERFPVFRAQGQIHSEFEMIHKNGSVLFIAFEGRIGYDLKGDFKQTHCILQDITKARLAQKELKRIEWLLASRHQPSDKPEQAYKPPYGDLVTLNTSRLILDSVGEHTLTDIVGDYLNLLDTSAAVYERNGDYALGIFSSGWCRFMDAASRVICDTNDNREALDSGRWHCHESCWSHASKTALETGQPADIECEGGIRLYAVPIRVGDEIIGAINFGYGDPPNDEEKLRVLASKYQVSYEDILSWSKQYESRPPYIIELAKRRLLASARLIGGITGRKQAEEEIKKTGLHYQALIEKAPDGIALIDAAGNFKYISPAAKKMFGYIQTDEVSGNPAEYTHPDDLPMVLSELGKIFGDPTYVPTLEYRFIDKFGQWHWVETTFSNLLANPSVESVVLNFRDITERKQNEEKLIKSEERYAHVIEASEQGIWDWNVETNEVFYSEQWKKQIGYNDHELKNEFNTWVEHLHPDEKEYCRNAVHSYLNQPVEHFILDFRFRHKDGTYRWIHNKAASLKNNEGKVIRLFGTHTDITESKLSEAIFKDIIEKNPISIQILDMEGYPIQLNSAHTKLFGATPPSDYSVLKDPQLLSLGFDKLFERIKKGEVVYFPDSYYNVHDVDPSFPDCPAWVKAIGFTLNDNDGNPNKIVIMHENITERKNAEALLNDIIENNPMSIQVVDKEGHTIRGNPAFIELFGTVPPPEFSIFDDLKSKSSELGSLVSLVKNGEIVHLPDIYFNAHDAIAEAPDIPLWIRALIFPLKDSAGKPERFVFMHENITERKIAEQELIEAKEHAEESDRLKSAFLANMSHEIRTPMNGILGFSELLKNPGLTGEQQQEYIGIIEKSGVRMLNIINDIVDISKIEAGLMNINIQETDINEKIEFIYNFFKPQVEEKGMQLLFKNTSPAKEAIIRTDNEKFYSILTNLVKNAIKFCEEGTIEFGYERKGNDIEFFVKDTGIGIPRERQEAIFERFIQADISDKMARQGAGLGLSISKAYVEMLGGKIWVESEEGIGTTFYFKLPCSAEPDQNKVVEKVVPVQNEKKQINPEGPGLKIVIAEDDETSEMLISIIVRKFSREIIKVRTGNEVVEICRNNPDIDLILMDIQMPGLNGYQATQQIRRFNKDVIIIAQTAFGLSGDREKSLEAGCNDYISKPVSRDELLSIIHKYFIGQTSKPKHVQ